MPDPFSGVQNSLMQNGPAGPSGAAAPNLGIGIPGKVHRKHAVRVHKSKGRKRGHSRRSKKG